MSSPLFRAGMTPLMGACSRRGLEVSIPIIKYLLDNGANAAYRAPFSSLLGEGFLCSRLGLSRDTPIKNAANQPELLHLLVDAGAVLDAHIVVYATEDWCDEIAGHLGIMWARDLANDKDLSKFFVANSLGMIDLADSDTSEDTSDEMGEATVGAIRPFEFGAGRVAKEVADLLGCVSGGDKDDGDEDSETKGDNAAATNEADSALLSLGASPFAAFSSQIAATLREVLDMGGDVNAPDTTGT